MSGFRRFAEQVEEALNGTHLVGSEEVYIDLDVNAALLNAVKLARLLDAVDTWARAQTIGRAVPGDEWKHGYEHGENDAKNHVIDLLTG